MSTTVTVGADALHVDVHGMDRLWTLTSSLTIPLGHVRGATPDPGIALDPAGRRAGGTHIPGIIRAGTFRQDGDSVFWNVHDPRSALVIELTEESFTRLVVEVDDPRATAALVNAAVTADQG